MIRGQSRTAFTIVELLIVVVVIAILAAITVVAYTGISAQARESAVKAEVSQNAKAAVGMMTRLNSGTPSTVVMMANKSQIQFTNGDYRVITYCTNGVDSMLGVSTTAGESYYYRQSTGEVAANAGDGFNPCGDVGMSGTYYRTYLNLPTTSCANENGTCTFTGTATVVYGNTTGGRFRHLTGQTSPLSCSNTTFGDPYSGFSKTCWVYPE